MRKLFDELINIFKESENEFEMIQDLDNNIYIKIIERNFIRRLNIYLKNEMIYIYDESIYDENNKLSDNDNMILLFSINSILLDELFENNDIIIEFFRKYLESIK